MTALDTSVTVAAFASWHEHHEQASRLLSGRPVIPAQVALETFSVLTRLPPPNRAPADVVNAFLAHHFAGSVIALPHSKYLELLDVASSHNLAGGSVYDAVVAATAKHAGATLLSLDRRAARTYSIIGVEYELI